MTVHDPVGDVPVPQGDLTGAGFAQNSTSFAFGVTVVTPTDPTTDPAWLDGLPFVGWALDTNNDGNAEYVVFLSSGLSGGLEAFLASASNPNGCDGVGSYVAGSGYPSDVPEPLLARGSALPGASRDELHERSQR